MEPDNTPFSQDGFLNSEGADASAPHASYDRGANASPPSSYDGRANASSASSYDPAASGPTEPTYVGPNAFYTASSGPVRPVQAATSGGVGRSAVLGALLLGALGGGVAGGIVGHATSTTTTIAVPVPSQPAGVVTTSSSTTNAPLRLVDTADRVVQVVKQISPAVVTIQVMGQDSNGASFSASGSGVIFDNKGDILTNNHVVANESSITVILQSGNTAPATLVHTSLDVDLAVIHIDAPVPAFASFGDSSKVVPGETVLAIGNPLGSYNNSVTKGIISAVGRSIQEDSGAIDGAFQTDAAINHGNSGGPLVDLNGRIIGINTAVVRTASTNTTDPFGSSSSTDQAQGLGFAIASNTVRAFLNGSLLRAPMGYLGVNAPTIAASGAALNNAPAGARVMSIAPNTPAATSGLQVDDIITMVDGQAIDRSHDLRSVIRQLKPGQTIALSIYRGGQTLTLHATLANRPATIR